MSVKRDPNGVVRAEGLLDGRSAATFRGDLNEAAGGGASPLVLDLFELDLDDSAATAAVVEAVRGLSLQRAVVLRHAPHWLAHSLYRLNALGPGLTLEEPREEEPYG